jgi:hypothetical protein
MLRSYSNLNRINVFIKCRYRDVIGIGFSHPRARYFLLLRLGNCSCVALDCCSRRNSTSPILGVVPPASLQSSVEGEGLRPVTWVLIEDVASGQWGVGGQAVTTDAIRAMSQASG